MRGSSFLFLVLVGLSYTCGRSLPKHRKPLKRKKSKFMPLFSSHEHLKTLVDESVAEKEQNPYDQPWVKEAVAKAVVSERQRWAMFSDDGMIHNRKLTCEDLKKANPRVLEYPPAVKHIPIWKGSKVNTPRILCWVFSTAAFHKTRAEAVRITWGKRCDGLLFFSDLADPAINAVLLTEAINDSTENLWHKMQLALVKLADDYIDDYDWFYKGDDDTHLLVENLRRYLLSDDVMKVQAQGKGAFVGRRMNNTKIGIAQHFMKELQCMYMGGGPGYLFDKVGLKRVADKIRAGECMPTYRSHSDDLALGHCAEVADIPFVDTRDKAGGERFHVFEPEICTSYVLPPDLEKASREDWYYSQTVNPLEKMAGCSPETVAFHHFSPQMMIETDKMWYECYHNFG